MPPIGVAANPLGNRRRSTVKRASSPLVDFGNVYPDPDNTPLTKAEAGEVQDIYPSPKASPKASPLTKASPSFDSIYANPEEFYGSKNDKQKTPPVNKKPQNADALDYFKNQSQVPSEIESLKREIKTNVGCKEVAKYRALLDKRGMSGYEFPKEPDYSLAKSMSEITQKQQQYLQELKQYVNYCNHPNVAERVKELRQEAIDRVKRTAKRKSKGGSTRRRRHKGFR